MTYWTGRRAATFLDVSATRFDELAGTYSLRPRNPDRYAVEEVVALSEALAAAAQGTTPGWRGPYYRDGFVHLAGLAARDQMDRVASWARDRLDAGPNQPEGAVAVSNSAGRLVRVNYLDTDEASVAVINDLPFLEVARELVEDAVLYRLSVVVRSRSATPELGPHRDPRWSGRTYANPVFAFGLSLESLTGEEGDVYYVAGTHQLDAAGTLPDANDQSLRGCTVPTKRGDAVLHNLGVVHGAGTYRSDRERVTVYCSYASAREVNSRPWGPGTAG